MIRIITDSTASIPHDVAQENDIEVITLYLNYQGQEYEDATMDVDAFYEGIYEMIDDIPTSSQPSPSAFEAVFERAAARGDEVLGIFMSSEMSGTVESALRAARSVAARYADFNFRIVDALSNSFDEAWSVFAAAAGRAAGCSLDQCTKLAQKSVAASRFLFTPESLRFLKAGGRIGTAAALLGHLMKLCPILTVTDGKTATFAKVRTHKKAVAAITEKFKSDIENYGLKNAIVHYIGSADEARAWAREVIEPLCGREIAVVPVSPVIGLHVGPAVGIAYECEQALPEKLTSGVSVPVHAS
jgi:DegV family protein with EDD domain